MHAAKLIRDHANSTALVDRRRQRLGRAAYATNLVGLFVGLCFLVLASFVWESPISFGPMHPMHFLLNPVYAIPFYALTLLALRGSSTNARHPLVQAWSICLLLALSLACLLAAGQTLTTLGLTRTSPEASLPKLALAFLPFVAWGLGLSALDVRSCFRPAWWVSAAFVPLLIALGALTVSGRISDGFIGLFRGPIPDDFGGHLSWNVDINDFIERLELVIVWYLVAWSIYVALGVARASRRSAAKSLAS